MRRVLCCALCYDWMLTHLLLLLTPPPPPGHTHTTYQHCQHCQHTPTNQVELSFSAQTSLLQGFTGLSDPSSLATILATIAPRSLLLLGGGASSSQELAALISSKLSAEQTSVVQPGRF